MYKFTCPICEKEFIAPTWEKIGEYHDTIYLPLATNIETCQECAKNFEKIKDSIYKRHEMLANKEIMQAFEEFKYTLGAKNDT